MTKSTNTFIFPVIAAQIGGAATLVGTNFAHSVRSLAVDALQEGEFNRSLFNSFGAGCFVPNYSTHGAYVFPSCGGHNHPDHFDAILFDFADYTWKRLPNTNGVPPGYGADGSVANAIVVEQTTGPPYYEIVVNSVNTGIPAPPHPYKNFTAHVSESAAILSCPAACTTLAINVPYAWKIALNSTTMQSTWTRVTSVAGQRGGTGVTVHTDTELNRYWHIHGGLQNVSSIMYLDGADWTYKYQPGFASFFQAYADHSGGDQSYSIFDASRRVLAWWGNINRLIEYIRLDDLAGGVKRVPSGQITVNGSTGGVLPAAYSQNARWHLNPADGKHYSYWEDSGNVLQRLTLPADLFNGTWAFDTVTVAGAALPSYTPLGDQDDGHHSRFFYVPSRQSFAWIAGGSTQVAMLTPP